jgi:hypothetical protein
MRSFCRWQYTESTNRRGYPLGSQYTADTVEKLGGTTLGLAPLGPVRCRRGGRPSKPTVPVARTKEKRQFMTGETGLTLLATVGTAPAAPPPARPPWRLAAAPR